MRHKFISTTLLLSLIMFTATMRFSYAIEWSPDMRLTWDTSFDFHPSIVQTSDGRIWVVWHSYKTGNYKIFCRTYNESLVHPWSPDIQLTEDPNVNFLPSIMEATDGKLWVIWSTNRTGNYEIFYKTSSDNGRTWSSDKQLTNDTSEDMFPSIIQLSTGDIWVVWDSDRPDYLQTDLYYKTSSDNGTSWSPAMPLTNNTNYDDWDPSIAQMQDSKIWIVWVRNDDLFYKIYNGSSWLPEKPLTNNSYNDLHPSIIQLSTGEIWVVWDSDRPDYLQTDLYYKTSSDNGTSWSPTTSLTTNMGNDLMPSILQTMDGTIWLAWMSSRLDNLDIYYRVDSVPYQHDVAVFSVTHNPDTTVIYRGANVTIEIVAQNQGTKSESIRVYFFLNSIQIDSQGPIHISAGQLKPRTFTWNTTGFAYGNYIIKGHVGPVVGEVDMPDNTYINGVVTLTLPGDVNGDGIVNAFDLRELGKAYGSTPSTPNWNPEADINSDGAINIFDIDIMSSNWGQSW